MNTSLASAAKLAGFRLRQAQRDLRSRDFDPALRELGSVAKYMMTMDIVTGASHARELGALADRIKELYETLSVRLPKVVATFAPSLPASALVELTPGITLETGELATQLEAVASGEWEPTPEEFAELVRGLGRIVSGVTIDPTAVANLEYLSDAQRFLGGMRTLASQFRDWAEGDRANRFRAEVIDGHLANASRAHDEGRFADYAVFLKRATDAELARNREIDALVEQLIEYAPVDQREELRAMLPSSDG
jgi:hypothetical protein